MKRLVSNMATVAKIRVFCLLGLALLVGANNVAWGQTPSIVNNKDQNMTYTSKGPGILWTDANNWTPSGSGNANGYFPGQRLFKNNPYGNFGGGKVTVNREITMPDMSSYYYADYRQMQNSSFNTIFNIQSLTLDGNAYLTLNDNLFLTGSGADPVYTYKKGTLIINEGASLIACKKFKLEKNQEITGGGKLILFNNFFQSAGRILTADIDVEIAPKYDNPAGIENNTLGDAISINVLKSLTITRQTDVTKNNAKLEFANIVVKPNATVTINNNKDGKQTVSSSTFKMEGGTLEIATGSKLSVTGGEKVLEVTGNSTLKGNGTLDVKKIYIAADATLTIDGTRTFDGIEFTGPGALKVADGGALTLNNTTFSGGDVITILKGETGTGTLSITGNLTGGTNSTFTTEVNTRLAAVGEFNGITTINVAAGTFTNLRLVEMANIVVADGATFSTRGIGVTNSLTLQGTLTGNNAITFTGSTVTFGENTSIATGSMVEINSNATISGLASCLDNRAEIQTGKNITYVSSTHVLAADYGTLTIDGGVVTLCGASTVASTFTTSNDVTLSGANLTFNSAISGGKTITANGITMTVDGDGALDAKFAVTANGTLNYNRNNDLAELNVASGSTVAFGSTVTVTDPTLLGTVSVVGGETLMLSGDITFGANTTITSGSDVQIASGSTINGLASCLNVTVANNAEISYGTESDIILGGNYSNLTVSANAELCDNVTVSGVFEVANSAAISGGYELSLNGVINGADKTLTADGITLNIGGAVVDAAVQPQLAVTGGGTLNYDRTTALSALNVASDGTANFGESVNATNATLEGAVSVDNTQTLTLDGTINFGANTTIGGEGSVHVASGSTVGNLVKCLDGVEIVADNEGHKNITYESTSTYVWSDTYYNMTIGGDVTLCDNVTVDNVLTWTAGNITLAGHELALTSSSAAISGNTTFGSTHMIVVGKDGETSGALKISNFGALLFPIGTTQSGNTQYSPVEITSGVSAESADAWVGITSANAIVPSGSPLNLKRWWDIDAENISVSDAAVTFKYDDDDSDTELFSALTRDGNPETSVLNEGDNTISASGLSTIVGRWTAVDNGKVFYSRTDAGATTDWGLATTWTLNPDGSDSGNTDVPTSYDNVEILEDADISINGAAEAKSVKIVGTLDYGKNTPAFRLVYGTGTLRVDGTQDFTQNSTRDYTQFMSAEGGTVELRGNFGSQAYWEFNNLVLNNDNSVTSVSPDNATILGDLTLTGSNIAFAGTESLTVGGNIIIGADQKLSFSSARTVSAAVIDASASGASVSVAENVEIANSVKLLGDFDVAENMALTLNRGTAAETEATITGNGNLVLANEQDLKGSLTIDNLQLSSEAEISGVVATTNLNFGASGTSVSGTGKLSVSGGFSPYQINTTVANFELSGDERAPEATIVVDGGLLTVSRRTKDGVEFNNLTINNNGKVVLEEKTFLVGLAMNGSAQLEANGETTIENSKLSGSVINNYGSALKLRGDINFDGIETMSGKYVAAINVNISNLNPTDCFAGFEFDANEKSIEYDAECTYIFASSNYGALTLKSTEVTICGDVAIKKFYPTKTGNGPFIINGSSNNFIIKDTISGGKYLTFNDVNPTIGYDGGTTRINVKQITVNSPNQLTIAGDVKTRTNHVVFAGDGDIEITDGSVFTIGDSKDLTFNNDQIIKGGGKLVVGTGLTADGKTLTTFASVDVGTSTTTVKVGEVVVNGGTFTYNNNKTLNKVTVNPDATFAAATADITTVKDMSVNAGTITIADGSTLKVSTTALQVAGDATITSGGASNIQTSNVELAADANLTINKGITLNNALVVNNNATITGGGTDATLAWGSADARKISAHSATLTLAGIIGIASDITLDGKLCVAGTLNLDAANVTFTEATDFTGTTGNINFSAAAVTINDLKVNPNAPTASMHFNSTGTVTYAASCTSMLPGTYNNLTLSTAATKNISLFDDAIVNGTLSWANGRIALNGKNLTVTNAFTGTFNGDHMIIMSGNSQLTYLNNTGAAQTGLDLTMPIGTTTTTSMGEMQYLYSPATLTGLSSIANDGYVSVNVKGEAYRGTSNDLVRYWTVSSSDANTTGALAFTYVDADDVNGYGASDQQYWILMHKVGDAEPTYDYNNHSKYTDNTINIEDGKICGIWTAVEDPEIITLYSYTSGEWGDWQTWTLKSAGSIGLDEGNPGHKTPGPKTDVVILEGRTITTGTLTGIQARSVLLKKEESSRLEIRTACVSDNVHINNLSGNGVLRIEGRGDFPSGIVNPEKFMAADGGTTEFYGSPAAGSTYELEQMEFNNLKINFTTNNVTMRLPNNASKHLVINGNLQIDNGKLEFRRNGQIITVGKNITLDEKGKIGIHGDVKDGNKNNYITLEVGGDLINHGELAITRRTFGGYTETLARADENAAGRGILHFIGEADARFECWNTTQISQLIIDKGIGQTHSVTLFADNRNHFALTGRANEMDDSFADQDNPPLLLKPLWLKNGTLELTGDIHIKTLSEPNVNDNAFIPLNGCLYLNGDNVEVDVCFPSTGTKSNACLMPAGKVVIDKGKLDCQKSAGVVFRNTSEIIVNGGELHGSIFRPSQYAANGKTTFIMTGGTAKFDGQGEGKSGYATFYMPFSTYTFKMTGGLLDIHSAQDGAGAFVINCNPDNSNIDGGEIRISTADAVGGVNGTKYYMICSIPLYNLTLTDAGNKGYEYIYKNFSGKVYSVNVTVNPDNLYVKNNLTIDERVKFTVGTNTEVKNIEVGGNLIVKSGAIVKTKTGSVVFNGGGNEQQLSSVGNIVSGTADNKTGFHDLVIDENSKLYINNNIAVNNMFTIADGAELHDGADNNIYTMNGNVEVNGTHVRRSASAGKLVLNGNTIYSNGNGVLCNVDINSDSEMKLLDPNSEGRQTKLTINGKLNFTKPTIFNIGSSNLTFGINGTVAAGDGEFGPDRMIQTVGTSSLGVTKVYSEDVRLFMFPFGFELGGVHYYAPATISYTAADVYGSVTVRPVSGRAFRKPESLNAYWISSQTGFENVGSLTQTYQWFGNGLFYDYGDGVESIVSSTWRGGRYLNGEWDLRDTPVLVGTGSDANERHMTFSYSNVKSVNGYYSCGENESFIASTVLYTSSNVDDENPHNWTDADTWSTEFVGGTPCTSVVIDENTTIVIGDIDHQHTVVLNEDGLRCASLSIAPGSTLDVQANTDFVPSIVDVDEAIYAGTIRIATGAFPNNGVNFEKFNGDHGGTVEYYGATRYTIPSAPANYYNLVISGGTSASPIQMPDANITVFNDFTVSGYARSAYANNRTVNIDRDFEIAENGTFEMWNTADNNLETYNVKGNVTVSSNAKIQTGGSKANGKTNLVRIEGDLVVDGIFNAYSANNKFDVEFVGSNESHISGSATGNNYSFNKFVCQKDNLETKLVLNTPGIKTQSTFELLELKRGTFEVAIGEGNEVYLTNDKDMSIPGSACLSIVSGSAVIANTSNQKNLTLNGHITISGGKLYVGRNTVSGTHSSIFYAADGLPSITITDGELIVNGQICRLTDQATGSLVWNQSGGDVLIKGQDRNTNQIKRAIFEIINTGKFDMSGGTITIKNGTGGEYGDIYLYAADNSCTGGKIIVDCSGKTAELRTNIKLHEIEIKNGSELQVVNDVNLHTLTIANTGVYNAAGHKLTIRKAFVNHNNVADDLVATMSKGFVAGSPDQLTVFDGTDMQIEGYSGIATQFGTLEINGDLSMTEGCSNIRVAGNLTQNSGTVHDNGNTITLYGNLMYDGSFVGTGGIDFVRSDARQTIGGSGLGSIGKVIVSNQNEVWLNTDMRITNQLVIGSLLYINRSRVILDKDATVVPKENAFDNTHMIRLNGEHEDHGVVKYVKKGASDFTLPIGITGHYTPVRYQFASNDNDDASITVKTINSLHKNLSVEPSKWLNYYWVVKTTGFGDDERDINDRIANFSVTQTYTYTDGKVEGTEGDLLPEYMYYGGLTEYQWVDVTDVASVDADNKTITFGPFGHIAGDYTAGVVNSTSIYTELPVLYTAKSVGNWENDEGVGEEGWSWEYYSNDDSQWHPYKVAPKGNPIHIRPGHTIRMTTPQKAYCLYFDKTDKDGTPNNSLGKLDIGATSGSDFGHVDGVGHLIMSPIVPQNGGDNYYKLPAGDFEEFLNNEHSIIEFSGDIDGLLPNSIVGHSSQPLQNVILSGTGTKTLTKEDGEYINGNLTIENGAKLHYGNTKIHIKGNWIDENTVGSGFVPGSHNSNSLVEFNGTKTQKIILSNNSSSFWNLKINNPNGVELEKAGDADANVTIGYRLLMGNGCITGTDDSHLIISSSGDVTGTTETSYVKGPLTKQMTASSGFIFPVGDATFAPTELSSTSAAGFYTVTFHSSEEYGGNEVLGPLTAASQTEYWTVASSVDGAQAKLKIRAGEFTLQSLSNSALDRLAVAGLIKEAGENFNKWEKIPSSYKDGSLPQANVQTTDRITLSGHTCYTIGYASTTARLVNPIAESDVHTKYEICDGDEDVTSIPIYFTGKGGPYTVGYKVTVDGVSKTSTITFTPGESGADVLSFSGNDLAALFGRDNGFKEDAEGEPMAYTIELLTVSEGGVAGVAHTRNKVDVTVFYNAVPTITGAKYVGMEDSREYTVATTKWDNNSYSWSYDTGNSAKPVFSATNIYNPQVTFGLGNKVNGSRQEYGVTLKIEMNYSVPATAINPSKTCKRTSSMNVNVMNRPQPDIHAVVINEATGDEFIACKAATEPYDEGDKYTYKTERVGSHTYVWSIETVGAGTIIGDNTQNTVTVVWNKNFVGATAILKVIETANIDGHDGISGYKERSITLRDNFAFAANRLDIIADACNNTYAEVQVTNPADLYYELFNGSTSLCGETRVMGSGTSQLQAGTYMTPGTYNLKVRVSNGGCSRSYTVEKPLTVRETPTLKGDDLSLDINDMYIGNLAQIQWEKTSSTNPANYSFAYGSEGVVYTGGKPDDFTGKFVSGRTIKIEVPKADKMKGVLTVKDEEANNKICSSTYDIAEQAISNDYLWRGLTADGAWNDPTNWWAKDIPDKGTNVVVREGKKITKESTTSDDTPLDLPKVVAEDAVVKNIKLESGSIEVDGDKKLTINGNVESAGEFKGSGTVEFSSGEHTVQGSSVKFKNLTNSGTVTANSTIEVTGTLNNGGIFEGAGDVKIAGGEGQQIKGGGTFYDITFSNSSVVEVVDAPTINHAMALDGGIVKADNQINIGPSGYMTGSSWVNGKVHKTWDNMGLFKFLVGSGEGDRKHAATVDVTPTAAGAEFTVNYAFDASKPAITDKEKLPTGVERVSAQDLWDIHGNVNSYITLYWSDYSGVTTTDGLVIAHEKSDGTWEKLEGVIVGGNSIRTKDEVRSYSAFTFGATNVDPEINPLPVTFAAFTGRQDGNSVVLEWTTMSENNNDYFEIERSVDGINYVTIGYVSGAGDSNGRIDYSFSDNAPEQGQLYYRLSQVDFDGKRDYADKVVALVYAGDEADWLTVVPNPTHGLFRINVSAGMADGTVRLMSQSGQVVRIFEIEGYEQSLDISDLPDGVYILQYVSNSKVLQHKVVKY